MSQLWPLVARLLLPCLGVTALSVPSRELCVPGILQFPGWSVLPVSPSTGLVSPQGLGGICLSCCCPLLCHLLCHFGAFLGPFLTFGYLCSPFGCQPVPLVTGTFIPIPEGDRDIYPHSCSHSPRGLAPLIQPQIQPSSGGLCLLSLWGHSSSLSPFGFCCPG